MTTRYAGEDIEIQFTVSDGNGAVPLSGYDGIICIFYFASSKTVLGKYSKDVLAGYNSADFVVVDSPNGIFKIRIQSDVTRQATQFGAVHAEIKVQTQNNDYDNNTYHTLVRNIRCFELEDALSKQESSF